MQSVRLALAPRISVLRPARLPLEPVLPKLVLAVSITMAVSLLGDSMLYAVLPAKAVELGLPLALVGVLHSVNR